MKQKIVVITGCSKKDGVGFNLASELLKRGHRVIATVRNIERSDLSKKSVPNAHDLNIKPLDLCEQNSIESFIKKVLDEYQFIDVLVNNAANVTIGAVEAATQDNILTTFQTKVFGPIALIQGFLPAMRERKQGLLIATSSIWCALPFTHPVGPLYSAAMSALERIQEGLAVQLAPWNIKVVNFRPGPIKTSLAMQEGDRKEIIEKEYSGFLALAFKYFLENKIEWQSAAEVAKVYADIIEMEKPDFTVQSNQFGEDFVRQYCADPTGNSYLNQWVDFFKQQHLIDSNQWQIEA